MFFVTELPVTFFLIALQKGDFYLFFIECELFFVTVLCVLITMHRNGDDMNKLDLIPSQETDLMIDHGSFVHPESAGRLIVLIPADLDFHTAARRIWELANATGMHVQLLGLCNDATEEPSLHRALVTMAALIHDGRISTEAKTEIGTNWLNFVKHHYKRGDMIVCFAEQQGGLLHRPLNQMIRSRLDAPMYIMSGLCIEDGSRRNWRTELLAWSGAIGIILGSSLFQIRISSQSQDWTQTVLLILSVIAEAWLIWGWNSLLS